LAAKAFEWGEHRRDGQVGRAAEGCQGHAEVYRDAYSRMVLENESSSVQEDQRRVLPMSSSEVESLITGSRASPQAID
jgi:hypothetical protein